MSAAHSSEIFLSEGSLAVRLLSDLGFEEGDQVRLVQIAHGNVRIETTSAENRKFDVDAIWGIEPGLTPITPDDRLFDERKLDRSGERLETGDRALASDPPRTINDEADDAPLPDSSIENWAK